MYVEDFVFNGAATYKHSVPMPSMSVLSLDEIEASLFFPPGGTISQHGPDLDTLLSFMISLVVPTYGDLGEPHFTLNGRDSQGHATMLPISSEIFQSSMEALVSAQSMVYFDFVLFSKEEWQVLQSMPFHAFVAHSFVLGRQFLIQTPAKQVRLSGVNPEQVLFAFTCLGMRKKPIGVVEIIPTRSMVVETTAAADILLGGLVGVSNLTLHFVRATPPIWIYIWLMIRQNKNLLSLEFDMYAMREELLTDFGGDDNLWWLKVVRDCLLENWFLESIKFPDYNLCGEALAFWQAEVMPLLKLNASHAPRLPPTKRRRLEVHDAIISVSSHLDKLRCLLTEYPGALTPLPIHARLAELEQTRLEDQETHAMLRATLGMHTHELAVSSRRINTLDESVADLRRQQLISNRRNAALHETVADLQRQVQMLQRQRRTGPVHFEEDSEEENDSDDY